MVGTAFDYLLRFEIQRRAPHAVSYGWIAEAALNRMPLIVDDPIVLQRAQRLVLDAKRAATEYLADRNPNFKKQFELACSAVRLAKLDPIFRAGYLDPTFDQAERADVLDILAMLAIVPFDRLVDNNCMLLNPSFGRSSLMIGGADADLITGKLLVDVKTTNQCSMGATTLDQLLGYCLLSRRERERDPQFPEIKEVGLYFSRHGYLWTMEVEEWTGQKQFSKVENWFFEKVAEVYQPARIGFG
jgi:hypothetical protein